MKQVTKIEAIPLSSVNNALKVAAYVRVSTSQEEQMDSLNNQTQHYQLVIDNQREWVNVGVYADEGISGTSMENREGLQSLIEDCRWGKVDLILTKSISRFSRNIEDCLTVIRELSALNVAIHFDKENLNTQQMDGELLLSILSSLAEKESKSISGNLKWAIRKQVENNTYRHKSAPFGYTIEDGNLVIHPEEAKFIQSIFSWYLAGEGTHRIAKKLNDLGLQSPREILWRDNSIQYILTNEKYVGDFLYQKTYTDSQFKRHVNDGDVDMLYIQDNHPALISRERFDRVQELLNKRSKLLNARPNTLYALSGKIKCGECGSSFKRRTHYSTNGSSYIAWCCSTHLKDIKKCPMKFVKEQAIQESFMTMMNKLIFGRQEIIEPAIRELSRPSLLNQKNIDRSDEYIRDCQNQLQILAELQKTDVIDIKFYHQQMNRLEREKKQALNEKKQYLDSDAAKSIHVRELRKLNRILLKSPSFEVYDEHLLIEHLETIEVVKRDEFKFNLKGGLHFKERR